MRKTKKKIETLDDVLTSNGFNTVERCSRCYKDIEKECMCCHVHPEAYTGNSYRNKPIPNPDLILDKGNFIYADINLSYLGGWYD